MGEIRGWGTLALWIKCTGKECSSLVRRWMELEEGDELILLRNTKNPKMRCHILYIFLPFLTAPPVVASNEAFSLCSFSKQSTREILVSTFDFDAHLSRSFIFSLWISSHLVFIFHQAALPFWCKVANDCVGEGAALTKGCVLSQTMIGWLQFINMNTLSATHEEKFNSFITLNFQK